MQDGHTKFRFDAFELDTRAKELRKHGTRVKLHGQPFQILLLLLERPGDVVTREEIRQKLWPDGTFVDFEHGVNDAIKKLRRALSDSAEKPRFVETLPRAGYRFLAEVERFNPSAPKAETSSDAAELLSEVARELDESSPPTIARQKERRRHIWVGTAVAVVIFGVAGTSLFLRFWPKASTGSPGVMLAVLPFQNLSGDRQQEYFGDGLTEETITDLGQLSPEKLGVIARTSAMAYKHTQKTVKQIGLELGVDYVLEGSVRHDGNEVRVSAQLIRVKDQVHLWSHSYDRELRDILELQNELGKAISQQVELNLPPEKKAALETARPVDPKAFDLYFKGLYYWNMLTPSSFRTAIEQFQQAVERDPNYAPGYTGIADSYALLPAVGDVPPRESFPAAQAAVAKALQLDDTLAQAHDSLARIKNFYEWDWSGAEKESLRAIALNPNLAVAHIRYAHLLSNVGRHKEALAEAERANRLDPLNLIDNVLQGAFLYEARQYDAALDQLSRTVKINPNFWVAHLQFGEVYAQQGRYQEAISELVRASDLSEANSEALSMLGRAYAVAGNKREARKVLAELGERNKHAYVSPYNMAMIYAGLGEPDGAVQWLEKAYEARDIHMVFLKTEPMWDDLRTNPRFQDVLHRMNFPP